MDCSLTGSPVNGIFQARVLEWVAIAFSSNSPYSSAIPAHIPLLLLQMTAVCLKSEP